MQHPLKRGYLTHFLQVRALAGFFSKLRLVTTTGARLCTRYQWFAFAPANVSPVVFFSVSISLRHFPLQVNGDMKVCFIDDFPDFNLELPGWERPAYHRFGEVFLGISRRWSKALMLTYRLCIHPRKYGAHKGFVYRYATCDPNLLKLYYKILNYICVFLPFFTWHHYISIGQAKKTDMSTTYVFCLETITFFFVRASG